VTLKNTIVANNEGGDCGGGGVTSDGHNLDSDGTCALTGTGDQSSTDPLLAALADNGGPTQTRALPANSPAVDAADDAGCPATDQRGVARPQDGDEDGTAVCDIGAFELEPPQPEATPTPTEAGPTSLGPFGSQSGGGDATPVVALLGAAMAMAGAGGLTLVALRRRR
jgi:hypothetical protein